MNSIQLVLDPLRLLLVPPCCYFTSSVVSIIPDNDAISCYANHNAGRMMDGLSDRPRRLAGGHFLESLTLSLLWSTYLPQLPSSNPCPTLVTPTGCLWPHIIVQPLLAMCWESKGSHLELIRMEPHHLPPHAQSIGWQTEMDWDVHDPVPSREAPAPPTGCCHWQIIEGGPRRSERVKSAAPGRKSSQCNRGKFFSIYEQQAQCGTACLTEGCKAEAGILWCLKMQFKTS